MSAAVETWRSREQSAVNQSENEALFDGRGCINYEIISPGIH